MPNWAEHELHVVGKKADIDRFVRVGQAPPNAVCIARRSRHANPIGRLRPAERLERGLWAIMESVAFGR